MDEKFILSEPERLELSLDQCRRLMSYMNSLVASVKTNNSKTRSQNRATNVIDHINLLTLQREAQDEFEANEIQVTLQNNIEVAGSLNHEKRLSTIEVSDLTPVTISTNELHKTILITCYPQFNIDCLKI